MSAFRLYMLSMECLKLTKKSKINLEIAISFDSRLLNYPEELVLLPPLLIYNLIFCLDFTDQIVMIFVNSSEIFF